MIRSKMMLLVVAVVLDTGDVVLSSTVLTAASS